MKRKHLAVLFGLLFSLVVYGTTAEKVSADEITVNTIEELQDAVKNAPEDRKISVGNLFPTDITATINLVESPYQIEVDGNGRTLTSTGKELFSYNGGSGTASSVLKLKNFDLQGVGKSARALTISGYKGEFILENTKVDDFHSSNDGSAFYTSGNTTLQNCTFSNNTNNASGYSGGAIASKGYSATFKAYNTKFITNQTLQAGTGAVGGEGGAIYFFQPSATSKFIFKNNYFEGNKAVETITGSGQAKLADGGAIAFFNTVTGTDILFDGNTFVKNIAGDDGGAILIQTNDTIDSAATFKNNTFYQNKALGQDLSANSGGAIQIYANGSPFQGRKAVVDYINNSFIENEATYDGGAIGSSGYITNVSAGRYSNNLFVGNKSRTASRNNIADSSIAGAGNIESNVGYDNGKLSSVTMADVFGTAPVSLVDNYNNIKAGTKSDEIILPTIPIAPEKLADDKVENLRDVNEDQRGMPRSVKADIGSIEIDWIKYDSNGGLFDLGTALAKYDGSSYYEGTQPAIYYQVGYQGLDQMIPSKDSLKPIRDGYQFAGWSRDKDAKNPDENLAMGQTITIPKGNDTLYAVWKKSEPVAVHYMTYDANKQLVQISPDEILTGELGEVYHAPIKQIDDYVFSGVKEGDSISGVFSDDPKEITLIYTKTAKEKGMVVAQYQDEAGKPLAGDVFTSGDVGADYTTTPKDIEGYSLKEVKGDTSGKYTAGIIQVIYVYVKNPIGQGKVTVHYQSEDQTPLGPDVELSGDIDESYTVEIKPFDGYVLKGIEGDISGKFTSEDQEVTVIYTKKGEKPITGKGVLIAEYQDDSGHPILNSDVSLDEIGKPYTTAKKEIPGYSFKEVIGNETGNYVDGITKVTYIYIKNVDPMKKGKVTIHYRDEQGTKLAEDFSDEQPIDTPLPMEQLNKTIESYTLKEITGMNKGGRYTEDPQEITVVYSKQSGKIIISYLTDEGKQLTLPIILNGAIGSDYQTKDKEKTFDGYKFKEVVGNETGKYTLEPQIVTYIYSNKGTVSINYVDESGNEIAPPEQKTGVINQKYETTARRITGWALKEIPKNAKGTFLEQDQKVVYTYKKETVTPDKPDGSGENNQTIIPQGQINNNTSKQALSKTETNNSYEKPTSVISNEKNLPKTGEKQKWSSIFMLLGITLIIGVVTIVIKRRKSN